MQVPHLIIQGQQLHHKEMTALLTKKTWVGILGVFFIQWLHITQKNLPKSSKGICKALSRCFQDFIHVNGVHIIFEKGEWPLDFVTNHEKVLLSISNACFRHFYQVNVGYNEGPSLLRLSLKLTNVTYDKNDLKMGCQEFQES